MPNKLTDEEIVKALNTVLYVREFIIAKNGNVLVTVGDFLDFINRLQAENERLTIRLRKAEHQLDDSMIMYNTIKAEAYKECIEKAANKILPMLTTATLEEKETICFCLDALDNLLKELVGENNEMPSKE